MKTIICVSDNKEYPNNTHRFVGVNANDVFVIDTILKRLDFIPDVYAVGGCVRDMLLNKQTKDIDVASATRPETVMALCDQHNINYIQTGLEHGTLTLVVKDYFGNDTFVEHTTFRSDKVSDGRHAVIEYSDSLVEDLKRRDFTLNAMAYRNNRVTDPFGGYVHAMQEHLVAVGNAEDRFKEDYLRIIRALRFATRFGFTLDIQIIDAIQKLAVNIPTHVSMERVMQEIESVISYGSTISKEFIQLFIAFNLPKIVFGYNGRMEFIKTLVSLGYLTLNRMMYCFYRDASKETLDALPISNIVKKWINHYHNNQGLEPHQAFWNVRQHLVSTPDYYDQVIHQHYDQFISWYTSDAFQTVYRNYPSDLVGRDIATWQYAQWLVYTTNN